MEAEFKRTGIEGEFLAATDGAELSQRGDFPHIRRALARRRWRYGGEVSANQYACLLSHRAAWEKLLDDSAAEYYAVLEDDVELKEGFAEAVSGLLARDAPDFVRLIATQGLDVHAARVRSLSGGYQLVAEYGLFRDITRRDLPRLHPGAVLNLWSGSMAGYLISKQGAAKLLGFIRFGMEADETEELGRSLL